MKAPCLAAILALITCLAFPVFAADELLAEHDLIADLVVSEVFGGETEGRRIVATPFAFDSAHEDLLIWTGGELTIPANAAWLAIADEMPGVLGFHPVRHIYLSAELEIIEVREETFYPRFYRDGKRHGHVTLLWYHAKPQEIPQDRRPATSPEGTDSAGVDGSYGEHYAVIIEGDVPSGSSYPEFWSDPVQMFRMLLEYGYQEDHIHVLYGEGDDETEFDCEYYRETMTDFPAYQQDVRNIFTWMRDGNATHGIDQVTDQDFIFLFTFDHGSGNGGCSANLCLMDGCMIDTEFASYFNDIPYKHRAVDMQQCNSGGFVDNLENTTTVISTAANCTESAYQADESDDCYGTTVLYGEWNYWWISAMRGHLPWPGLEPVNADTNGNGTVSFLEAHNYALANDDRNEHPMWSDLGGIGDELGLQTSWAGAHLRHISHEIDDSATGNDDGVSDAGEAVVMPVTLENAGEEDATDISATLTTDNAWVSITDDHATFPNMSAEIGSGRSNPDHYAWSSDPETPDDTQITFHLDWTSNAGTYFGTVNINETVVRVMLGVQQNSVLDDEGGNGDGIADPGESIHLAVTLRNRGHADAHGIHGVLTTSSPWASVTQDQAEFEDTPGQASGRSIAPHFSMEIDPGTPDKSWIHCELEVSAADGYLFTLPLKFMVGSRGTVLLIEDGDAAAADLLEEMVSNLGFGPIRELASETDPDSWTGYSLLLWCAGENADTVSDAALRDALETYVAGGGRLLMEGGELGYDHRYNTSFRESVLHESGWNAHGGGAMTVADDVHPVATVPNVLDSSISLEAPSNSQQDAVTAMSDAQVVLDWETRQGKGSVVTFDDDSLVGNGGQIVNLFVDTSCVDDSSDQRRALMDNALDWLIGNDKPYLVIDSHTVLDAESGNDNGIVDPGETVTLVVNLLNQGSGTATQTWARAESDHPAEVKFVDNFAEWSDIGSSLGLSSLAPHFQLHIDKDTPCGTVVTVTLEITTAEGFRASRVLTFKVGTGGGQHLVYEMAEGVAIPNPGILDSVINVPDSYRTGDVNCFINVDHSSTAFIKIILQDPDGVQVLLHSFEDMGNHLETTYDSQTQPHGPGEMSDYDGKVPTGDWHLYVNDLKDDMLWGRLNAWRLIFDTDDLCHDFDCDEAIPSAIGDSLRITSLSGTDIHLEWNGVGGASRYNIWRARRADMSSEETAGSSETTSFDEIGLPQNGAVYFYQIRAENSCHQEGP